MWKEDSNHTEQRSNQPSEYIRRGMPRSKRRAPSSTNHQQGLDTGTHEEMSRHPSKRIRHMSRLVKKFVFCAVAKIFFPTMLKFLPVWIEVGWINMVLPTNAQIKKIFSRT